MNRTFFTATICFLLFSCSKEKITDRINSNAVDKSTAVSTGLVYIAKGFGFDSATLYALDIKTGFIKWQYTNKETFSRFSYTPCVAEGALFMQVTQLSGGESNSLIALNANTGKLIWKTLLNNNNLTSITNPTFENGNVYIASEKKLFCINAANGKLKWKIILDSSTSDNELCSPTVQNNSIYIGNKRHFFALNAADGSIKWQVDADLRSSTATVANGLVTFINNDDGSIYGYDFKGNLKWKSKINDYLTGSTTASQNVVYQYAPDPAKSINYFGLDVNTGSKVWEYKQMKDNNQNNYIYGDPFYIENTLYITLADSLIAINAKDQSTKKWSFYAGLPVYSNYARSSVIAGRGLVFDMALDANLYALAAKDGSLLWKFQADDQYYSYSPVVLFDDGVAIHPTNSGMTQ